MIKALKKTYYGTGAALMTGILTTNSAVAQDNDFSKIASNITTSIESVPGLLTALSYLVGLLLGVLGVLKIKDHVENPSQTPLKEGAIRLAAGGALFALPIVYEAMFATVGDGAQVAIKGLNKVSGGGLFE